MTTEHQSGNATHEQIGIPTEDGVKNIHPDVLNQYRRDAFAALTQETKAKAEFKELVEAVEEATGIKKGVISKWFKASFKDETEKVSALGKTFEALDEAADAAGPAEGEF
jgi:hypothetical protein